MTQRLPDARVFALLTDGTQVEIRLLGEADQDAVRELHRGLSEESLYLRFFGLNRAMAGRWPRGSAGRTAKTTRRWAHGCAAI